MTTAKGLNRGKLRERIHQAELGTLALSTVTTGNTGEFVRIRGRSIENWLAA